MANQKLTHSTDEVRASGLLTGRNIFDIPYFQRPYKWDKIRIQQFEADLLKLLEDQSEVHFLGAIITHARSKTNATQPDVIEVIDGQQRLTTLYLYLCGATRTLIDVGALDEARSLFQQALVDSLNTGPASNLRLHTSHEDRRALNGVVEDLLGTRNFGETLIGFTFRRLAVSGGDGPATGQWISKNYEASRKFFRNQYQEAGLERVQQLYNLLMQNLTLVQIAVQDPTNGPKIFDSLNSRQQPMTTGDLVRNDIFARVATSDPDEVDAINRDVWLPFYGKFQIGKKNFFDEYFFPFGLVQDHRLPKSGVYKALIESWDGQHPTEVIAKLARYQAPFLDLVSGSAKSPLPTTLRASVRRFHDAGAPASTYPFLMTVIDAAGPDGDLDESVAAQVFDAVEAFLLRRQLCGIEPTGLHAVFKGLWADCKGQIDVTTMVAAMSSHSTLQWPTDEQVIDGILRRKAYGAAATPFVLREYDRSFKGDPHATVAQVEHVLPQKQGENWTQVTKEQHKLLVNTLGNLVPLSSPMNASLSNRGYDKKRIDYMEDSAFKSTRTVAARYVEWTAGTIHERGSEIGAFAVAHWPDPRLTAELLR